jgi:hypothetical protein
MTRSNSTSWLLAAVPIALASLGCQAGGVGDPCIPEDEYQNLFGGYSVTEVNVESRSFQCETRVCLVNHFQGRVSCPYGQSSYDIGKGDPDDPTDDNDAVLQTAGAWRTPAVDADGTDAGWNKELCRIPGTRGRNYDDRIWTPVPPQKVERRRSEAVYCSCRCKNADGKTNDGARYCDCPNGFKCEHLIDDVGLGSTQLAGSYCVKKGTQYNEAEAEVSPDCTYNPRFPGGADDHPNYCGVQVPEW